MKKQLITKEIFRKDYEGTFQYGIPFKDFPKDLQPDDKVSIFVDDSYSHEGNYYTTLVIFRELLETDDEFLKRVDFDKKLQERNKKARHEQYLKLKKEFEGENKKQLNENITHSRLAQ